MRAKWLSIGLIVCVCLALAPISAQGPAPAAGAKKAMELGRYPGLEVDGHLGPVGRWSLAGVPVVAARG